MSGELKLYHTSTGATLKAMVLDPDGGKRWDGSSMSNIDSITDANWGNGLVSMTEEQTSNATVTSLYVADFPSGITTAGEYFVIYFSGASPSPGDRSVGQQTLHWTGTAQLVLGEGVNVTVEDHEITVE